MQPINSTTHLAVTGKLLRSGMVIEHSSNALDQEILITDDLYQRRVKEITTALSIGGVIYRNNAGTLFYTITPAANGNRKYQVTVWDRCGPMSDSKHDSAESIVRHYCYGHEFKIMATQAEFGALLLMDCTDAHARFLARMLAEKGRGTGTANSSKTTFHIFDPAACMSRWKCMPISMSVIEFKGDGDPFFGGTADDRALGKHGKILTKPHDVRDVAEFSCIEEAYQAALLIPNRREGSILGVCPKWR